MKIVKLWGGLGNQLFQYAFGEYLSKLTGEQVLYVNKYGINDFCYSLISKFNCNLIQHNTSKIFPFYFNFFYRLSRKLLLIFPFLSKSILVENINNHFTQDQISYTLFDGYWQDLKFVFLNKEKIKSAFKLQHYNFLNESEFYSVIMNCESSVAIHIRRTDFLTSKHHEIVPIDYYTKAIQAIRLKIINPIFFIFSDDITWVKNNLFIDGKVNFVTNTNLKNSDLIDFCLMSICANQIIANSTFSWWAAWLNNNPNKIVFAPKIWYSSNNEQVLKIIPEEWEML